MKAAIDIGTNSVLLLVAETKNNGIETVIREEQKMPRIGKGVDANGNINRTAIDRLLSILADYKCIIETEYTDCKEITVTATSAVRDAGNKKELLDEIKETIGFNVSVLSGDEEARFTYRGALAMSKISDSIQNMLVLDIGGGSTEIALGNKRNLLDFHSYDIGCVRFTERYLKNDPPKVLEIEDCRNNAASFFESRLFELSENTMAIGVAGTLTTLAAMDLNLKNYDANKVNGHKIDRQGLQKAIDIFATTPQKQILDAYGSIIEGRVDVFMAGLLILKQFLEVYDLSSITISTGGIRHGALLEH